MGIRSGHIISYENAQQRCKPREIERWAAGFQRMCPKEKMGYIEKQTFVKDVLGPTVPKELAERIFRVFASYSDSLSLRDFVCGMVIFLKGTPEEKAKFVFNVYDTEHSGFITKEDMARVLAAGSADAEKQQQAIEECLKSANAGKLTMKDWKKWVAENRDSGLPLTAWIYEKMEDDGYVSSSSSSEEESKKEVVENKKPVDLVNVTMFNMTEINFLSKQYNKLLEMRPYYARTKKGNFLDRSSIVKIISPPLPEQVARNFFAAIAKSGEDNIDFTEFVCGISKASRGTEKQRISFIFKIFDTDRDGKLSRLELQNMVQIIWHIEDNLVDSQKTKEDEEKKKGGTKRGN